jgi:hypothetical protein
LARFPGFLVGVELPKKQAPLQVKVLTRNGSLQKSHIYLYKKPRTTISGLKVLPESAGSQGLLFYMPYDTNLYILKGDFFKGGYLSQL